MDIKTLAQQYIWKYKSTSEFDNWDTVIELGKQLADAVLADVRSQQSLSLDIVDELTKQEREYIESNQFILAVKSVRERLHCGLLEAKTICDKYNVFIHARCTRSSCGGCLKCSPVAKTAVSVDSHFWSK